MHVNFLTSVLYNYVCRVKIVWWGASAAGHNNSSDHHYSNICSEVVTITVSNYHNHVVKVQGCEHHSTGQWCLTHSVLYGNVHMSIAPDFVTLMSQLQVVSGSHSMVQLTRTTVLWHWRTSVKVVMLSSAWLTNLLVADLLILVTGL